MLGLRLLTLGMAALVSGGAHAQTPTPRPPTPGTPTEATAFVDVNVVPMDRERVLPNHTVVVEGGRITALGPVSTVKVPTEAIRIDGRGKYLIPGLGDCHVHLGFRDTVASDQWEQRLFLYVANGVTTIRNMDHSRPYPEGLRVRDLVAAGKILGPRLYIGGGGAWSRRATRARESEPNTLAKVRLDSIAPAIAAFKAMGHDFIKAYYESSPVYDSVLAAAHRLAIPVMGHIPDGVRLEHALRWKQASIEHLEGYTGELVDPWYDTWDADVRKRRMARNNLPDSLRFHPDSLVAQRRQLDFSKISALAEATARAGVWNCPTQRVYEMMSFEFRYDTMPLLPELEYIAPAEREAWQNKIRGIGVKSGGITDMENGLALSEASGVLEARRRLIKGLQDAGAGLLLGTDLKHTGTVPGVSVHRELQALVRAGLTPYQALATGTRNVAAFFKTLDETGTVAVGKRADLVLLNGNPLQDIRNTMQPAGVMLSGRWLARAELDRRLAAIWAATP